MSKTLINPYRFVEAPSGIVLVNSAKSALSNDNRTSHSYTYNFESTTQDGSVALLIAFLVDASSGITITPETGVVELVEGGYVGHIQNYGLYIPDQTDLNAGSKQFTYTTNQSQGSQFVVYELSNVDTSTPLVDTYVDDSSSLRTTAPGGSVNGVEGGIVVIGTGTHVNYTGTFTMSPTQGFTMDAEFPRVSGAVVGYLTVSSLQPTADGVVTTPTYNMDNVDNRRVSVVGVSLRGL